MMMMPRRRNEFDLLEDMFRIDPFFSEEGSKIMKTDIKEKKDKYLLEIDLPGYEKEDIKIHIEDGYLNIHAKTNSKNDEKEDGKFVRKERYYGECSRSFYIGDNISEDEIHASSPHLWPQNNAYNCSSNLHLCKSTLFPAIHHLHIRFLPQVPCELLVQAFHPARNILHIFHNSSSLSHDDIGVS